MAVNPSQRTRAAAAIGVVALLAVAGCRGGSGDASSSPSSAEPEVVDAPPTQAAIVDAESHTLVAIADGEARPLDGVEALDWDDVWWSPDGSRLVADISGGFWEWAGPGSGDPQFHECADGCEAAFAGDDPGELYSLRKNEIQEISGDGSGHRAITAEISDDHSELLGVAGGDLIVGTPNDGPRHEGTGYLGTEQVWSIDPSDGKATGTVDLSNQSAGFVNRTAVSADGGQVAIEYTGTSAKRCNYTTGFSLVDTEAMVGSQKAVVHAVAPPPNEAGYEPIARDMFFNGGSLYAAFGRPSGPSDAPCQAFDPMGVWRWSESGWEQVSEGDFNVVRPLEALDGKGSEAALIQDGELECRVVDLPEGELRTDLGRCDIGVWSTPTRNEIDLSGIESY